ncbi:diacylglycerol/lipid kinase family protein [Formosa sp. PL04]|uniref:diacylglycerol/lipid kinase family protein n=1 Tax=Formosa sp. PL04 TaxID=3081755 RepID=UPI002980E5BE|nr:diacylglycerol kinase family protein [Formosa sp. PL04]MDW5290377.1 diacylglycerol kinase family protein [Formosa sp. PL04]
MKLLFVVNPISGGVNKEPFLEEAQGLCNNYGIEFFVFKTTGTDDDKKLEAVLKTFKPDKVVSVGGDGTTLFTAIVLQHTNLPMGIIPLGSANGMAIELEVQQKPIEALKDIIMSDVIGELDMVVVNDLYYSIHIGDVGINAAIVNAYDKDEKRGMATYVKYFIEALSTVEHFKMTIECNNEILHTEGIMVGICNSRKYGTGVPINLNGNPMDGLFEIVIIEDFNVNSLISAGLSSFNEKFSDSEYKTTISTTKAKISFETPRLLQLDGEIIGEFKTLDISVLKGSVKFITTQNNSYLKAVK